MKIKINLEFYEIVENRSPFRLIVKDFLKVIFLYIQEKETKSKRKTPRAHPRNLSAKKEKMYE